MLTVDQYARIRQLRRDGRTIRQIAQELNHAPKTILKALTSPEPVPRAAARPAPVFGAFRAFVDEKVPRWFQPGVGPQQRADSSTPS
jgi:hypothetical protein